MFVFNSARRSTINTNQDMYCENPLYFNGYLKHHAHREYLFGKDFIDSKNRRDEKGTQCSEMRFLKFPEKIILN